MRDGSPSSLRMRASAFSSRSTAATFQPASSSGFAVASPMPDAAPVMSATRPSCTGFAMLRHLDLCSPPDPSKDG